MPSLPETVNSFVKITVKNATNDNETARKTTSININKKPHNLNECKIID